jgi:negative regulator of flagellin synthesis FlgM
VESPANPGAKVELSPRAKELDAIRSMLDRIPDVDEARVAELRSQIEKGTYQPDLAKVADGLLQEAFSTSVVQHS